MGITAFSCTSGAASATVSGGSFSKRQSIAVDDVSVAGYNNVFTLTSVSGDNLQWSMTCPGTSPSAANFQGYYEGNGCRRCLQSANVF